MSINPKSAQKSKIECKKSVIECQTVKLRMIDSSYFELRQTNAVFRLERATEILELTYLGKYFACVNAN